MEKQEKNIKTQKEKVITEKSKENKKVELKEEKTSIKKETIRDIILVIGLIIVVVIGCFVMKGEKVKPNYTLPLVLTGEVGLHELTYDQYKEKIENNEHFVLIIESATCSHCVNYMPVAESFANDNNVPMYYIDTNTILDEEWDDFEKSNTFFKEKNGDWGTPTTIVLAGKEAVDYIVGETTADDLKVMYGKYFEMEEE